MRGTLFTRHSVLSPQHFFFYRFDAGLDLAAGAVVRDGGLARFERELAEADAQFVEDVLGALAQFSLQVGDVRQALGGRAGGVARAARRATR